jgi:hypothetical protein
MSNVGTESYFRTIKFAERKVYSHIQDHCCATIGVSRKAFNRVEIIFKFYGMKKIKLDPLALDKETIAKLDENQLLEIVGGSVEQLAYTSSGCSGGSTDCGSTGTTIGCTGGNTKCLA